MPISALSASTVRLLRSSAGTSTPHDLVKELVDNAIDADATQIDVLISQNVIDRIQVQDNGSGIDVGAFDSLGRPAHTSKLRSFADLQEGRCKTLGFRGEALSSANTLASITITTRTINDPIASRLQLKPGVGGVESRFPVSAPVGTTMLATKLFETLPVRKQHATKESQNSISRIRDLLHAYVLAQPDIKLTLKVYGTPKPLLSYTPSTAPSARGAALQLFGQELVNSCMVSTRSCTHDGSGDDECIITLEALLPKPTCDVAKVRGKGAFISVDSRPLSSLRGTAKKLYGIAESELGRALHLQDCPRSLSSFFLQLNVRFSRLGYDPNVTSLKDEVLFVNETDLLGDFEDLCREFYRPAKYTENSRALQADTGPTRDPGEPPIASDTELAKDAEDATGEPSDELADISALFDMPVSQILPPTQYQDTDRRIEDDPDTSARPPTLVTAIMRTNLVVNMSRTKSDQTDEDSLIDAVEIHIPSEPLKSKKNSEQESPSHASRRIKPGTIQRYFKPSQEHNFEIATDESSTSSFGVPDLTQDTIDSRRPPLAPLPVNPDRNRMMGRSPIGEPERETTQHRRSRRPHPQRPGREPPSPSHTQDSEVINSDLIEPPSSSSDAQLNLDLHTPPRSDSPHAERSALPRFRPPRHIADGPVVPRASPMQPRLTNMRPGLQHARHLQPRELSADRQPGIAHATALMQPSNAISRFSISRDSSSDILPRLGHGDSHNREDSLQRHDPFNSSHDARSLPDDVAHILDGSGRADETYQDQGESFSRMAQILLMRTPSPGDAENLEMQQVSPRAPRDSIEQATGIAPNMEPPMFNAPVSSLSELGGQLHRRPLPRLSDLTSRPMQGAAAMNALDANAPEPLGWLYHHGALSRFSGSATPPALPPSPLFSALTQQTDLQHHQSQSSVLSRSPPILRPLQSLQELRLHGRRDRSGKESRQTTQPLNHPSGNLSRVLPELHRSQTGDPSDVDPRRYLIRGRRSQAASGRHKRMLTKKLPLETVPPKSETHGLIYNLTSDIGMIQDAIMYLTPEREQSIGEGLFDLHNGDDIAEGRRIERLVRGVAAQWTCRTGMDLQFDYFLVSRMEGKAKF